MTPETVERLLALNRHFYDTFSEEFSGTRRGIPPGMKRLLAGLPADAAVLDLGCGNGRAAIFLALQEHHGGYHGLDASQDLLDEALRTVPPTYSAEFIQVDLGAADWERYLPAARYDVILAFAVLHHIPGPELRHYFVKAIHARLRSQGCIMLSNWQFLTSPRLRARIQPWEKAGFSDDEVDEGDYLLDWRHGGSGLRYVHHFNPESLAKLAEEGGFRVRETFLSDGEGAKLNLYQVWEYNLPS